MTTTLPKGQLVANDVIDTWILKQLEDGFSCGAWAGDLIKALPVEYAKPDGRMEGAMRAVDRSLQRLKRAGKIRISEAAGRPKWILVP